MPCSFSPAAARNMLRAREAIQKGGALNQTNADGETPFFGERCYRDETILHLAAVRGLDFEKRNHKGKTIFLRVAESGDLAGIKALVRAGAPVPQNAVVVKKSERTVEDNRTETIQLPTGNRTVKRTIKGGKTIQYTDETPLIEYAKTRDQELYRMLLRKSQTK